MAKRTLACVMLLSLICHGQEAKKDNFFKRNALPLTFAVAATGFDAWATERNLSRPISHENNPLVPHTTWGRVGFFGGGLALEVEAFKLSKKRHRLQKWGLIALGAFETACAVDSVVGYHK
jgi:hypothetical protein